MLEKIGLNTCGFVRSWYPIHSSLSFIQYARPELTNGWFWMLRTRRLSTPTTECLSWLKQLEPQFLDKYSFLYSMTFMLPNLFLPICSIIGKNLYIPYGYRFWVDTLGDNIGNQTFLFIYIDDKFKSHLIANFVVVSNSTQPTG